MVNGLLTFLGPARAATRAWGARYPMQVRRAGEIRIRAGSAGDGTASRGTRDNPEWIQVPARAPLQLLVEPAAESMMATAT